MSEVSSGTTSHRLEPQVAGCNLVFYCCEILPSNASTFRLVYHIHHTMLWPIYWKDLRKNLEKKNIANKSSIKVVLLHTGQSHSFTHCKKRYFPHQVTCSGHARGQVAEIRDVVTVYHFAWLNVTWCDQVWQHSPLKQVPKSFLNSARSLLEP